MLCSPLTLESIFVSAIRDYRLLLLSVGALSLSPSYLIFFGAGGVRGMSYLERT
jgi:hypothetical protein